VRTVWRKCEWNEIWIKCPISTDNDQQRQHSAHMWSLSALLDKKNTQKVSNFLLFWHRNELRATRIAGILRPFKSYFWSIKRFFGHISVQFDFMCHWICFIDGIVPFLCPQTIWINFICTLLYCFFVRIPWCWQYLGVCIFATTVQPRINKLRGCCRFILQAPKNAN